MAPIVMVGGCYVGADDTSSGSRVGLMGSDPPSQLERIQTRDPVPEPRRGDLIEQARDFMFSRAPVGALGPSDDFRLRTRKIAADGLEHLRLDQTHQGVQVWGADVVVHVSDQAIESSNGTIAARVPDLDIDPAVSPELALAAAKDKVASETQESAASLTLSDVKGSLVIFPTEADDFRLAWRVTFTTGMETPGPLGRWNTFVDAHTGDILDSVDTLTYAMQGSGLGGNQKVHRSWNGQLDVEQVTSGLFEMSTDRLQTRDSRYADNPIITAPLTAFNDLSANDAHGFAELTLDMMRDWFGYDSIDDAGERIVSQVHFILNRGEALQNALWNGARVLYGDGGDMSYAWSSDAGMVAHEIHHGFTERHSNLGHDDQPGAMNESFSDIAGVILKFYLGGDDAEPNAWLFGADLLRDDEALRFLCDPPRDGKSAGHIRDYRNNSWQHYNAGIFNKAFCMAARRLASGSPDGVATQASVRRVGQAWYLANEAYWTQNSDFVQGCTGILQAAAALDFSRDELAELSAAFLDVGLVCGASAPSCTDETQPHDASDCVDPEPPAEQDVPLCGDGLCGPQECVSCPSDCGDICCFASLSVDPVDSTVTAQWSTDAWDCEWSLDGVFQHHLKLAECAGTASLGTLPPGPHSVTLRVTHYVDHDYIDSSCDSNTIMVPEPAVQPLPSCSASLVTGRTGPQGQEIVATWASNGDECTWNLNGVPQPGVIDCSGSSVSLGEQVPPGAYSVTLHARNGSGTTTCSSNTVRAESCAVSVGPTSGSASRPFTAEWSSSAQQCTWRLDGVDQGDIPCTGQAADALNLAAGSHRITLVPSGTPGCHSSWITVAP